MDKNKFNENFKKFLKENLEFVTLTEQESFLKEIPAMIKEYEEKSKKDFTYCNSCKKYIKTKYFKTEHNIHTTVETTLQDAGYGDDDLIGEVEYEFIYETCPKCGNKKEKNRYYRRTLWEKRRSDL